MKRGINGKPLTKAGYNYLNEELSSLIAPFEPNTQMSTLNFADGSISSNTLNDLPLGYSALTKLAITETRSLSTHKLTTPPYNKLLEIDCFNNIFSNFYDILINEMNSMREKRVYERNKPTQLNQRGRPTSKDAKGLKYRNSFSKPFTMDDLRRFLACILKISTINESSLDNYWIYPSNEKTGHGIWFGERMSKSQYTEMFRCIDGDIDLWVKLLNQNFSEQKVPTPNVCIDETMLPYRGHFMFVPRKPHPYGMKAETIADSDLYIFRFNFHRRTLDDIPKPGMMKSHADLPVIKRSDMTEVQPKSVQELVLDLCSGLTYDHTVVGDNYFGSLEIVEHLSNNKIGSVMKCMNSRPTNLWTAVHDLGFDDQNTVSASLQGDNGGLLYAYSMKHPSVEKFQNLLSNHLFSGVIDVTQESVDAEGERVSVSLTLHNVFQYYNIASSYVDEANRSLMSTRYRHRIMNYRVLIIVFLINMVTHNSRCLFVTRTGTPISQIDFVKNLANQMFPVSGELLTHVLVPLKKRSKCGVCYWKSVQQGCAPSSTNRANTSHRCQACNIAMCGECFQDFSRHAEYAVKKNGKL